MIEEDNNYDEAISRIEECTTNYKNEAVNTAKKYADKKDYENALETLNNASSIIKDDDEVYNLISVYKEMCIDEYIAKADKLIKEKKLTDAENAIKSAPQVVLNSDKATAKLDEINELKPIQLSEVHVIDSYYVPAQ